MLAKCFTVGVLSLKLQKSENFAAIHHSFVSRVLAMTPVYGCLNSPSFLDPMAPRIPTPPASRIHMIQKSEEPNLKSARSQNTLLQRHMLVSRSIHLLSSSLGFRGRFRKGFLLYKRLVNGILFQSCSVHNHSDAALLKDTILVKGDAIKYSCLPFCVNASGLRYVPKIQGKNKGDIDKYF